MISTASELCRFYVLLFTIHLCNVTLLLHPAGEMTKVKSRSIDSTEDSNGLTIAYFDKNFVDKESSFSALFQEKNSELSSLNKRVKSLQDKS